MLNNFTLRQLAYFVTAAEEGSTSKAAEVLHLNQSSMSSALTELESIIGVALFLRRRGKGLTLTPVGEELLPAARRTLRSASEFEWLSRTLQTEDRGTLNIGCFDTIAPAYLPRIMAAYRERFPGVQVKITESNQGGLVNALEGGRIEMAITYSVGLPPTLETSLVADPLPHALLPADHRLAGEESVALSQLIGEQFIMINNSPARELITELFERQGLQPRILHHSSNFDHVRAMVHQGIGYTLISQIPGTTPPHWGQGVVPVPLKGEHPGHSIVIAVPKDSTLTRRARHFRTVAGEFRELTGGQEV